MKMRNQKPKLPLRLEMRPMVDIVFQLLVFFLLTFHVAAQEGDFHLKMPGMGKQLGAPEGEQTLRLKLTANESGGIAEIKIDGKTIADYAALRKFMINYLGDEHGEDSRRARTTVEIEASPNLNHGEIIHAICAVSGYRNERGETVRLIEKLRFRASAGDASP